MRTEKTVLVTEDGANLAMFPLKYEWAWAAYRAMLNNIWVPEEKGAAEDIENWKMSKINDDEKHMYLTVFSQLTTFDLLRTIDLGENVLPLLSAPEVKQAVVFQAAQEAIHNHAYTYLIESIGFPQDDIYQRYKHVKELRERCEMAEFYGNLADPVKVAQGDASAIKDAIVSLTFFYCIFEGVWFYLNLLGPVQSLARRRIMLGTATQFQYIARDEQTHVMLGINIIKGILAEHPYILNDELKQRIVNMVKTALHLEDAFIACALPNPILGYNTLDHQKTARHYAERWLKRIGIDVNLDGEHRLSWVDEQMSLMKEKNFFETRVTEYMVGADLWGKEEELNSTHPEWDDPVKSIKK